MEDFIKIRKSQINYYQNHPLYYKADEENFVLYKPAGKALKSSRLADIKHPALYISKENRLDVIKDLQKKFNNQLKNNITSGNVAEVKTTICNLVEETLSEPRSGTLQAVPETIDIMVSGYSDKPGLLRNFLEISQKDYTTAIHSVNVMALTLGFCFYCNYSLIETKRLGLSALLHDVGKTEIPSEILTSNRKLTYEEFKKMQTHTSIGSKIIENTAGIEKSVALGALEHHEKLDGSGYPEGKKDFSTDGQLIGIIDCYEALTAEDRPYRRAKNPFDTLMLLKEELTMGKFNKEYFEKFCTSLV